VSIRVASQADPRPGLPLGYRSDDRVSPEASRPCFWHGLAHMGAR